MNFISLEDNLFTTGHRNSYFDFNNPHISEDDAHANIDRTVESLFSVVAALGKVPIIQCPKRSDAAERIARKLDLRLRDHLSNVSNLFTETIGTVKSTNSSIGSFQRPVLIILDRNTDLALMLSHAWTYQALIHDLFDLHLNRVKINTKGKDSKPVQLKYNLDPNEPFWKQNVGLPIPQVALAVKQQVAEVEAKSGKKKTGDDQIEELDFDSQDISRKLDLIPELKLLKERIDMHTKIALAILDCINTRGLDVINRIEEEIITRSALQKKKDLIVALSEKGTPEDKMRIFLIYYITHQNISSAELAEFEEKLTACGCDLSPLKYLKAIKTFDENWATTTSQSPQSGSSLADLMKGVQGIFSSGIQLFVPAVKDYYVTRIVDSIMEIKQDKMTADYLYFDPKYPHKGTPRRTKAFQEAIVFMVGGGNYLEFQNLKEYAESANTKEGGFGKKSIIYGTTEMLTGEQFLKQLSQLGNSQKI
jgi:hypothetical protein